MTLYTLPCGRVLFTVQADRYLYMLIIGWFYVPLFFDFVTIRQEDTLDLTGLRNYVVHKLSNHVWKGLIFGIG
jgi:hypothetical protein